MSASLFSQNNTPSQAPATKPKRGDFGSSSIWQPSPEFVKAASAACNKGDHADVKCAIKQMEKAGAPKDAVKFTRELYGKTHEVGMLGEIQSFGPVSLAWIVYPFRDNDRNGLMLLNGKPNFINPDDFSRLDRAAMQKDAVFQEWKKSWPKLDVSRPERTSGGEQVRYVRTFGGDAPGSQRFLFSYPLTEGCRECARHGFASYWWDFDAQGNFLGAHFLSVTRGMPPKKPAKERAPRPPAPASAEPSTQQPSVRPPTAPTKPE